MADDPYVTRLDPEQEKAYQQWRGALPRDLQNDGDYDLRGAFATGMTPSANNHLPDMFKKPNHVTFSKGSIYSNEQTPGGEWVDLGNDKWVFNASQHNVDNYGVDKLREYFGKYEPGNLVTLPDQYEMTVRPPPPNR